MNKINMKEITLSDINNNKIDINENSLVVLNINKEFDMLDINLNDKSSIIINIKYKNKKIDSILNINLNGYESNAKLNLNTLTNSDECFTLNINHNNEKTVSNIVNHGVVVNDSSLKFIVNTSVKKGSIKSILNQESKIIVLSDNKSEIKPNMYIDEYDVEAYHSATIGKFNKDEIFYLMSKGISYDDSLKLLINGFLGGEL